MVIVSGGISVGDYDFVGKALKELHIEQLFYQVNQKPGKPLYFGKKDDKIIFALPGNPAAALSCFYVYIYPALQNMSGASNTSLQRTTAVSMTNYNIKGDRSQFLKAKYNNGNVEILDGQNSSMLHTFALANALVHVKGNSESIKINDVVDVILLPIH
jgi:molybdopterin molybdotransferase